MRRRAASRADLDRHLRQFQHRGRRREGLDRAGASALIYETLMTPIAGRGRRPHMACWPRPSAHPDDFSWVIYRLRKQARWHDGKPVTPDDVIFSFDALKKNSPMYAAYYRHVDQGRKDRRARRQIHASMRPATASCRSIIGELMVLPKHWWEGTDGEGRKRDISATTLETPLGSGPYRIKEFVAGRSRRAGAGQGLLGQRPARQIGQNNFDEMRFEFFRDNHGRAGSLQGRSGRLDRGEQRQAMGDRL